MRELHGTMAFVVGGLVLLLALGETASAGALPLTASWELHAWQTDDGLPTATVESLALGRDGYLLLGLHGSAARFDGLAFTPLPGEPPLEPEAVVRGLHHDADGTTWLATLTQGLVRVTAKDATFYGPQQGLPAPNVADVCRDGRGTLWVGTTAGLARLRGETIEPAPHAATINTMKLACADDGVWVVPWRKPPVHVSDRGLRAIEGLPGGWFHAVTVGRDGRVWLGGSDGVLARVDADTARATVEPTLPTGARVSELLEDATGALWIGTVGAGVLRLEGGRVHSLERRDGLPDDTVNALTFDREGSLWVATRAGLGRVRPRPFVTLSPPETLSGAPTAVLADGAGRVFVGTESNGVDVLSSNGARQAAAGLSERLPSRIVVGLGVWSDGRLMAATPKGVALDQGPLPAGPLPARGRPLLTTSDGAVWMHVGDAILRIAGGSSERFDAGRGLPDIYNVALAEDGRRRLWAGSNGFLHRYTGERFVPVAKLPGRERIPVHALTFARDGSLWIGTGDGAVRVLPGALERDVAPSSWPSAMVQTFGGEDGVGTIVSRIVEDRRGDIWIGARAAIHRLALDPQQPSARPTVTRWRTEDGLGRGDFSLPASPGVTKTPDGRLWFSTGSEIVVVDPEHPPVEPIPPPVAIEAVTIDGVPKDPTGELVVPAGGSRRVEIRYAGLSLRAPERVRFRHRLEGLSETWTDAGATRTVAFSNLGPQSYTFHVEAAFASGAFGGSSAELRFEVAPRLFERWPVRLGLSLLVVLGIPGAFHLTRVRRLRLAFRAVTEERNRIARELHDRMEQSLTALALRLKAAVELLGSQRSTEAREHVLAARSIAKHIGTEARHAIWDLRGREGVQVALPAALAQVVSEAQGTHTVTAELTIEGTERPLPKDVETTILRVAQEAITNVLKHADARHVRVRLTFAEQHVALEVEDDGRGFHAGAESTGRLGILGMRERAGWIGAALSIESRVGHGTRITLRAEQV